MLTTFINVGDKSVVDVVVLTLQVLTTPFANGPPLSASVTFPLLLTIVNVGGGKSVVNDVLVDSSALL